MKAVWYESKGAADQVLQYGELPDPVPGPGEVRIALVVSGLNPTDVKMRGAWNDDASMPYPMIVPHQDGAGTIDAVGSGVAESRIGQRVWVYQAQRGGRSAGTAAEYVVVPHRQAVRLPDATDFDTGACLGIPAMTAHRALFSDGGIQGDTIFVAGGGGAVGAAAIQLARWAGARVITTVSRMDQQIVAVTAGAHLVINRKTEDVAAIVLQATEKKGVDRIVEVALDENLELDFKILKQNGVIAAYAANVPTAAPAVPVYAAVQRGITIHFVLVYTSPNTAQQRAIADITASLTAGAYRPVVGARFPLSATHEAHRLQESHSGVGKILIDIRKS